MWQKTKLDNVRRILDENPEVPPSLWQAVTTLVGQYEKLEAQFNKVVKISDGYQVQLRNKEVEFRSIIEKTSDGVLVIQGEKIVYSNENMGRIIGEPSGRLKGRLFTTLLHPKETKKVTMFLETPVDEVQKTPFFETRLVNAKGKQVFVELNAGEMLFKTNPARFVFVRDITDRKLLEHQLRHMNRKLEKAARTDPLTQLPNRRDMVERLELEAHRFDRNKAPFALLMADIDHFKRINDTYGHAVGDAALVQLAGLLRHNLRGIDHCARWGGEEFLMVLPSTDLESAMIVAEKVRTLVEQTPLKYRKHTFMVTMSIGIGLYDGSSPIDKCLRLADDNLYKAKEGGRNRFCA